MENVATHEDWKVCFSEFGPGLLLFARQWVRSPADAEDIVQEAFVKFWRRNHKIDNGGGKPERVRAGRRVKTCSTLRNGALDRA